MTQPWPTPTPIRPRTWPIAALILLAVVLAAAGLIVALARSGSGSNTSYTATQKAAAKTQLCDSYRVMREAVVLETHAADNVALARISQTNGAVMLQNAAANPALDDKYRDTANSLAAALLSETALGGSGENDPKFLAAVDNTNSKDREMKALCGD